MPMKSSGEFQSALIASSSFSMLEGVLYSVTFLKTQRLLSAFLKVVENWKSCAASFKSIKISSPVCKRRESFSRKSGNNPMNPVAQ
jgi:hypothetical protein